SMMRIPMMIFVVESKLKTVKHFRIGSVVSKNLRGFLSLILRKKKAYYSILKK
ncbi:hypothetical protein MKX03_034286, partial [Papaver bracteatum]